ncbi:tRNA pseudouridine synthase B [Buchnera aphidicola (Cinara kochiana kochiana)]|uniref:tRNA pseudouridine synthase B n=1 Tax=Buchnera aphidicola (Cinara kochiana kochiana) TaxID=2518976 RepID=A0A451D5P6_9GAMM|nr:tRNA pseudouridine(55) synthase TruB [Buchnera aphidicola]VFP81148.1 tRNA pseudouridine synthase B [Buchnera aphidicola (Cinara kochiana kochiana)]
MAYQNIKNNSGILLLDKPKDISSNGVLQHVRKIFYGHKAGYTGSLDPIATGVLPILFNNATKFSKYLTNSIKKYHVIAKLGVVTDTGDLSGEVLYTRSVYVSTNNIINILNKFIGAVKQIPPMFSAIKYHGTPLYKYARLGIVISRYPRTVIIYQLNFIKRIDKFLEFTVLCSKGTYIRSLVYDIGNILKCGAHVVFLRRLQIGPYYSSQLVNLSNLYFVENKYTKQTYRFYKKNMLKTFLLPVSSMFLQYPQIKLFNKDIENFKKKICISVFLFSKIGLVRVVAGINNMFLGIGKINKLGLLVPKCILQS